MTNQVGANHIAHASHTYRHRSVLSRSNRGKVVPYLRYSPLARSQGDLAAHIQTACTSLGGGLLGLFADTFVSVGLLDLAVSSRLERFRAFGTNRSDALSLPAFDSTAV